MSGIGSTALARIASFTESLAYSSLPEEVVRRACDCFFDTVGCYFGALGRLEDRSMPHGIAALNPAPEASVWGLGIRCGIAEAALIGGCLAYDLEYDDGVSLAGHWGSSSIPAAFFSNVFHNGSGKNLICAIVAAYEAGTRISRFYSPRLLEKNVHFPCTMGAFAAITGYAKAAGLDAGAITGALSLAGLFPLGAYSTAISGAPGKCLYAGWPNYLGINAVRFSRLNLRGDADILEHQAGFSAPFGLAPLGTADYPALFGDLGKRFCIMDTYFKPYPCNRWFHAPVAAALKIKEENRFSADDVVSVVVYGPSFMEMYNIHDGFDSKVRCQYSLPYAVGAALTAGKLGLEEFESPMPGKALLELVKKIQVRQDPVSPPSARPVRVEITLKNGVMFSVDQSHPWSPENPPSEDELIAKFSGLTASLLPDAARQRWIDCYTSGFYRDEVYQTVTRLLSEKIDM
jgi:2-methylcitrate dehydratase PrpD